MALSFNSAKYAVELHSGKTFLVAADHSRIEGEFLEFHNIGQLGGVSVIYAIRLADVKAYWVRNAIHQVPGAHGPDFWDKEENIIGIGSATPEA